MSKKFVDINNLKIVWDEINKRFIRSNNFYEELEVLNEITFKSTTNVQLRPNNTWNVDQTFYDNFINFVNAKNITQYILDADGIVWDVICKTFYDEDINKFTGVILSSNDTYKSVHFWYLKITQSGDEYILSWEEHIGEISDGEYVTLNQFTKSYNELKKLIENVNIRLTSIENKLNNSESSSTPEPDNSEEGNYNLIKCYVYDENGNWITDSSIIDIKSIDTI